jgi:hypothetical protein
VNNPLITPGDGGEAHSVTIEYKVLLKPGDRTEARARRCEMPAGDATKALAFAIYVFQSELTGMYPDVRKVWDVAVLVQLAGDVLWQKLEAAAD